MLLSLAQVIQHFLVKLQNCKLHLVREVCIFLLFLFSSLPLAWSHFFFFFFLPFGGCDRIAGVEEIGHFEKILYKITAFLLLLSLLLTGIIMGVLIYQKVAFLEVLAICVVLLVASIPIAMNVVCTSTMAIGSRKLALGGAIVTRLGSIEELAGMDMLCSDKTGTLTLGKMQMKDILVYETGMQKRDILKFSALAAKWYEPAKDAIDRLVLGDVEKTDGLIDELNTYEQLDYTPFDPATKKTASIVKNKAGKTMEVSKGAVRFRVWFDDDVDTYLSSFLFFPFFLPGV